MKKKSFLVVHIMRIPMRRPTGFMASIVLSAAFLAPTIGRADLDEQEFASYATGELNGQQGWVAEAAEEGKTIKIMGRVEVIPREGGTGHAIQFKSGALSRIRKYFPRTTGPRAIVRFEIKPGNQTLSGGFYFGDTKASVEKTFCLQFTQGMLRIPMRKGAMLPENRAAFRANDWNVIVLKFDFLAHEVEVKLNDAVVGTYACGKGMMGVDFVNLWAGGTAFASELGNLRVVSAD